MAIGHKNITENDLHENKGASTATSGQFCVADGAGGTNFRTKFIDFTFNISNPTIDADRVYYSSHTLNGVVAATDTVVAFKNNFDIGQNSDNVFPTMFWISADNTLSSTWMNVSNVNKASGVWGSITITVFRDEA